MENDHAEVSAHVDGIGKNGQDFVGGSVGRDVVIGRIAMEQQIADAAADQKGLVAAALERVADRIGQFPGVHRAIMRCENEVKKHEARESAEAKLAAAEDEAGDVVGLTRGAD